jgi:predicted nuclease of predicted toxin-antitoxin system
MKLLFDENLSPQLVPALADLYPDSTHVRDVGLASVSDQAIWEYAGIHGFTIVSKDNDFQQRSFAYGHPPRVIWLRVGNCSTADIELVLRSHHGQISDFETDAAAALLVLA